MSGLIIPNQTSLKLKTSDSDNPEKHKKNRGPENIFQLTLGLLLGKKFYQELKSFKVQTKDYTAVKFKVEAMLFQQENTITGLSDPLVNKKRLVVMHWRENTFDS